MKNSISSAILRIIIPYVVLAGLWILMSDWLMAQFISDAASLTNWAIAKGWVFVATTALLLSILLRSELKKRERSEENARASEKKTSRTKPSCIRLAKALQMQFTSKILMVAI